MNGLFVLVLPALAALAGLFKIRSEVKRRRDAGGDPYNTYERSRRRSFRISLRVLLVGTMIASLGTGLIVVGNSLAVAAASFLLVAGLQMMLSGLGVEHELLANSHTPLPRWRSPKADPHEPSGKIRKEPVVAPEQEDRGDLEFRFVPQSRPQGSGEPKPGNLPTQDLARF